MKPSRLGWRNEDLEWKAGLAEPKSVGYCFSKYSFYLIGACFLEKVKTAGLILNIMLLQKVIALTLGQRKLIFGASMKLHIIEN